MMNMETQEGMIEYIKLVLGKNDWILNKDDETLNNLIEGLVSNKKTLGYQSCPCRLTSGKRELDRDLICPCDYAPDDIKEYGACFCNLYLKPDFYDGEREYIIVPERRPIGKEQAVYDFIKENS